MSVSAMVGDAVGVMLGVSVGVSVSDGAAVEVAVGLRVAVEVALGGAVFVGVAVALTPATVNSTVARKPLDRPSAWIAKVPGMASTGTAIVPVTLPFAPVTIDDACFPVALVIRRVWSRPSSRRQRTATFSPAWNP